MELRSTRQHTMPAELPLESFWELIERSGVIGSQDLAPLREEYENEFPHLDQATGVADDLVVRKLLTRWQASMLLQGRHKGFNLGPYRLLDLLGKGGMGSVYLAEHQLMRRRSAVKVLPSKQISRRPSMLERFTREAQAVAVLDHPNIVRAYEFNKELLDKVEVHFLAMEFVEGQDLQALVDKEGVLDFVRAADLIRQAALGLAHAHDNNLVHRDVKPANLLIDKKGIVKLLDLGLVKSFQDAEEPSLTGEHENTVLGTADYLAPEQAVSSRDVDARADIYSLGYTFYFSLTGHPPFPEGTIHQRMAAHQSRHASSVTEERANVPAELVAIVDKMVAKMPVDRYQSAADVAEGLANWLFENGDEDWILGHPSLIGDRSEGLLSTREPTHDLSNSSDETELDLLPLEEEEPKNAREKRKVKQADEGTTGDSPKPDKDGAEASELSDNVRSLSPIERDPIGSLLKTEPVHKAVRALRPMKRLANWWTPEGMAQRMQIPIWAVFAILVGLFVLSLIVAGIIVSSLTGVPTAHLVLPQTLQWNCDGSILVAQLHAMDSSLSRLSLPPTIGWW